MELLKKLIQIPSFSGKEGEIRNFLARLCQRNNLPVFEAGENLVVKFSSKKKKLMIFNAHLDTVPAGDPSKWKYSPFGSDSGKELRGKIYGLGASDEKASIASLVLLAKELKGRSLANDVWLTFVVREETDGSGTQSFLRLLAKEINKYREVAVVVCEPTGLKEIQIGHKGNVFLKVIAFGDSGHGSEPEAVERRAISEMFEVGQKMEDVSREWQKLYDHKILGKPTIGFTSIFAGDSKTPNKFPDSCLATFDIRTTPQIHDKALSLVKKQLGQKIEVDYLYQPCPFGLTLKGERIVKVAKMVLPEAKIAVSNSACDLCFFSQVGVPGIVLGPGEKKTVHKPNEFCWLFKIGKAVKVYRKIIDLW